MYVFGPKRGPPPLLAHGFNLLGKVFECMGHIFPELNIIVNKSCDAYN